MQWWHAKYRADQKVFQFRNIFFRILWFRGKKGHETPKKIRVTEKYVLHHMFFVRFYVFFFLCLLSKHACVFIYEYSASSTSPTFSFHIRSLLFIEPNMCSTNFLFAYLILFSVALYKTESGKFHQTQSVPNLVRKRKIPGGEKQNFKSDSKKMIRKIKYSKEIWFKLWRGAIMSHLVCVGAIPIASENRRQNERSNP